MTRKVPLCRNCAMPMKGHSKSGCLLPKSQTASPEPKDDGTSIISSTPSFVIPETGLFRRQNPNYVWQPSPELETLVMSSASLTPTEPVHSANTVKHNIPPLQQSTPGWNRRSSPQQQSSLVPPEFTSAPLSPASVFGVQPEGSVKLVACIYELPSTSVKSMRARALSNGIYSVPVEPLSGPSSSEESMQNINLSPPSTWIVTGPKFSDVDALVAVLRPRGLVWRISQIRLTAITQMVRDLDALHYGAIALFLLYAFKLIFNW
ncbi:hypothetical protein BYT27DRAFT_6646338 [Phlegmacium glaucopus]|nr:hypothetical protein BYT27DRAFT_6646338 [Phlegmacium glaucopus]